MRREQAKQSAVEAKEAVTKQKDDNYIVASMLREQVGVLACVLSCQFNAHSLVFDVNIDFCCALVKSVKGFYCSKFFKLYLAPTFYCEMYTLGRFLRIIKCLIYMFFPSLTSRPM